MTDFAKLLQDADDIVESPNRSEDKMARICRLLIGVEGYDLVGFYLLDPDGADQLIRGPYEGLHNPHAVIPPGKGISSQVVERQVTIVLDDVNEELNYIPVDPDVRSEIALPIFRQGAVSGLLDVVSKTPARFGERDRLFLEELCLVITDRL